MSDGNTVFDLDLNAVCEQPLVISIAREFRRLCNKKDDQQSGFWWKACTVALQRKSGDDGQIRVLTIPC